MEKTKIKKDVKWVVKSFSELTIDELYNILYLRCKVFEVEQNSPYLDTDYKDQKAIHVMGYVEGNMAVYCRLFRAGDYFDEAAIGRVVADTEYRRFGYGHQLMDKAIDLLVDIWGEYKVTISAQLYLREFYESHGFVKVSDVYLEDGIPHIRMKKG